MKNVVSNGISIVNIVFCDILIHTSALETRNFCKSMQKILFFWLNLSFVYLVTLISKPNGIISIFSFKTPQSHYLPERPSHHHHHPSKLFLPAYFLHSSSALISIPNSPAWSQDILFTLFFFLVLRLPLLLCCPPHNR